jgi:hypothetical protein
VLPFSTASVKYSRDLIVEEIIINKKDLITENLNITFECNKQYKVIISSKDVYVLELPGKHCFFQNGKVLSPWCSDNQNIVSSTIMCLASLYEFSKRTGITNLFIVAHGQSENVAKARAQNLIAFFEGGESWAKSFTSLCNIHERKLYLKWVNSIRSWNCDPGNIENPDISLFTIAANRFRIAYKSERGIYPFAPERDYVAWHDLLQLSISEVCNGADIDTWRKSINFLGTKYAIADVNWPPSKVRLPNYAAIHDNKLEILGFPENQLPPNEELGGSLDQFYGNKKYFAQPILADGIKAQELNVHIINESKQILDSVEYDILSSGICIRKGKGGIIRCTLPQGEYDIHVRGIPDKDSTDPVQNKLLTGELKDKGRYKSDGTGFENPDLHQLLTTACSKVSCSPGNNADGYPSWILDFQNHLLNSPRYEKEQQVFSRLIEAYIGTHIKNLFYTPEQILFPQMLEELLKIAGQSKLSGAPTFAASGMNKLSDPYMFSSKDAQKHEFTRAGLWLKLIPTVKPLSDDGVKQVIPRIAAFLHDLGGETLDDYLSVVCPPGYKDFNMANMSGCGLTTLFIWRTLGIADDELWRKYEVGLAIAYLLRIAKRYNAWIDGRSLTPAINFTIGDCLLVGDPSENDIEHVLTVASEPQWNSDTKFTFMGLNGGGTKNGKQHIANVPMESTWDSLGKCWRIARLGPIYWKRKLRGVARTCNIPCTYEAYVVPYPGDSIKINDGTQRQVICIESGEEKIARSKPFWTVADPGSSVGALHITKHTSISDMQIQAIGIIANNTALKDKNTQTPAIAVDNVEKMIASGKVATREKNSTNEPDFLSATLGVPLFEIKPDSTDNNSWVNEDKTLIINEPGSKLHIRWLAQNYEKVILEPPKIDLTELTNMGTPVFELDPAVHLPASDGSYSIHASSGDKTVVKKVFIQGILEFKITAALETEPKKRPEFLQREMKGLRYGTPNFNKAEEVHGLEGSFRELNYPGSDDYKHWWWGQITPHAESKLHWKVVGPEDLKLELAVNRKLNSKDTAAVWDVTDLENSVRDEMLLSGSKYYTWNDHPAAAPDGSQLKINGRAQFIPFFEADLVVKNGNGEIISSVVIRLRENYEMPSIDEYNIVYKINGEPKGTMYPGNEETIFKCTETFEIHYKLKGDHSHNGLRFVIQTLDSRQKIIYTHDIRSYIVSGMKPYDLVKDSSGVHTLDLNELKPFIQQKTECRAYLELFNRNGCVHRQG